MIISMFKTCSRKIFSVFFFLCIVSSAFLTVSCNSSSEESLITLTEDEKNIWFENSDLKLRFDQQMNYKVFFRDRSNSVQYTDADPQASDFIKVNGRELKEFTLSGYTLEEIQNEFGKGKRIRLTGNGQTDGADIEKHLTVEMYEAYPDVAVFRSTYTNAGSQEVTVDSVYSNYLALDASLANDGNQPYDFWSYQGSSIEWGIDYIFKLDSNFKRENWMGVQPETKTGGGVPVMDFWTDKMGVAIAHIEPKPQRVSFPVEVGQDHRVQIGIRDRAGISLAPGESYKTVKTALFAHELDYFEPLTTFAGLMKDQGLEKKPSSEEAYEAVWCGWGYLTDFTLDDIYGTLPKLKDLGLQWVVIDDRWWDRYGDWNPRDETFPGGEEQVKQFVDSLHNRGFKTKIWWVPTSVQPADPPPGGFVPSVTPGMTDIERNHKDWLIMDENGNYPRDNRGMYQFCPAIPEVKNYIRDLTVQFIDEWGFDGHKLDAYYVVPPCYNPAHNHEDPEESYQELPGLIEIIYETSKSIKPYSVTEICNCGTTQDFYQSLYTDQPVTSDPVTFEQERKRTKAFKALWGADSPIYNDHVEIIPEYMEIMGKDSSEIWYDFASLIGTGGVPGTKFTWPEGPEQMQLTPEKQPKWEKWFGIYQDKMLSKGTYLNLYDIAYDKPETHVIRKDDMLYYSFYDKSWNGKIELRGLGNQTYEVYDYVKKTSLGRVTGPDATLSVEFEDNLLIECRPVPS